MWRALANRTNGTWQLARTSLVGPYTRMVRMRVSTLALPPPVAQVSAPRAIIAHNQNLLPESVTSLMQTSARELRWEVAVDGQARGIDGLPLL